MLGGENLFSWQLLNKWGFLLFFFAAFGRKKNTTPHFIEKILYFFINARRGVLLCRLYTHKIHNV